MEVVINEYPQLRLIAWQLDTDKPISGQVAFALYERNWRHVDIAALQDRERELIAKLTAEYGNGVLLV